MTVTYCLAGLFHRPARPANTLAVAALATLALNPANLFDVGCQLSFLAVGAIVWGVGPVSALLRAKPDPLDLLERRYEPSWRSIIRRGVAFVREGLIVSVVVWLAAWPLVALRFHLVSPIGVLLNVPLVPLTSIALLASGLALGLSAIWSPLGIPAARVGSVCLDWTEAIVRWGSAQRWGYWFVPDLPWFWVLGFYGFLGFATAAGVGRWPLRKWAWGAFGAWIAVGLGMAWVPPIAPRRWRPTSWRSGTACRWWFRPRTDVPWCMIVAGCATRTSGGAPSPRRSGRGGSDGSRR
jgi:competence protein ComEC